MLSRSIRKAAVSLFAVTLTVVIGGGSALAHECYNASRSAKGNEAAANSPAFFSIDFALTAFCGIEDEARRAEVKAALEDEGYPTDILIHSRTLMAGGVTKNDKNAHLLSDGKGIDHLGEGFFGTLATIAPECAEEG